MSDTGIQQAVVTRLNHLDRVNATVFALAEIGLKILYEGEEGGDISCSKLEAVFSAISLISDNDSASEALSSLTPGGEQ